ncbi:proteasome adapter and scaffold protein ECM29 [Lycorma delicatula]|uniref:proteasome adapter and scaffold protein ECM29 n=1 Tax=Lycorma delicatula TaxID=130591 RepID=UPI003F51AAAD
MADSSEELVLLERVFLRIGSGETDEQLENSVSKFLPPVLLKMASPHEDVRNKVVELCIHVSKRLKSRPLLQLPVDALLSQYMDSSLPLIVKNLTIVYIKMGYSRMAPNKQVELIPLVISTMKDKPQEHVDSLVMLVVGALYHIKWPRDPSKHAALITSEEKPKILSEVLLDVLLMPYGWTLTSPVPSGLSSYAAKRIVKNLDFEKITLEKVKQSVLTCINNIYKPEEILCHLVAGSGDQWSSVSNVADNELEILLRSGINWNNPLMLAPLYSLYIGSNNEDFEKKREPASLRLKLKILPQLAKAKGKAIIWPLCIKIIFDALHGESAASGNVTPKLISLGLNYCSVVIEQSDVGILRTVSRILLDSGLQQLVPMLKGSPLQEKVYSVIGQLVLKIPDLVKDDLTLLSRLFNIISQEEDKQVQIVVRETLMNMVSAYSPSDLLLAFLATQIRAPSFFTRLVALRYLSDVFPANHIEARFWLLTTTGDSMPEVATQGLKALYGQGFRPGTKWKPVVSSSLSLPDFSKMTKVVSYKVNDRKSNPSLRTIVNNKILPFDVTTYTHIVTYLRLCLINTAGVNIAKDQDSNPVDIAVLIGHYLRDKADGDKILDTYLDLNYELLQAEPGVVPLTCILEVCGSVPNIFATNFIPKYEFIKSFLKSRQSEMRELASMLCAIVLTFGSEKQVLETELNSLEQVLQAGGKDLEHLHGCLLTMGYTVERSFVSGRVSSDWPCLKKSLMNAIPYLEHSHPMLKISACISIGEMSRVAGLPLDDGTAGQSLNTSVDKMSVLKTLQKIVDTPSSSFQLVEEAYKAIGSFCLHQEFPHRQFIIDWILENIKSTKAVDVHICLSKVIVNCVLGPYSLSARDAWRVTVEEFQPPTELEYSPDEILSDVLQRLLGTVLPVPHPNSRQACCICLLALLKQCGDNQVLRNRLIDIQSAFFDLLSENNDIVQDAASKGLALVYENGNEEMRSELIKMLVDQLTLGRRTVAQVTQDTELFEKGALGTTPSGGNLSTYRELCSLASELNQPDLIYKFMHLANHNAAWTSKMGAAFGFSSIAAAAGEQLITHKSKIIPKLYRYQFDPTPKVQNSMASIWHALVPETNKTVDQYHREIFEDLITNLTSGQWRIRISCCSALSDFLVTGGKGVFDDCIDLIPNLWNQLFRVMDDVHEQTRQAAINTARSLSKLCVRCCESEEKKSAEAMMKAILPLFLGYGIGHQVRSVRAISIKTVSQLVKSAGVQLRPHLAKLVPTLLEATGELHESLFTQHGNDPQLEGVMDNVGSLVIKSHHSVETITKCVHYINGEVLGEMLPRLVELLKSSSSLAPRVATANFLILLSHHLSVDQFQPHVGKLLSVLVGGLSDRNRTIRRTYASCIGQLVRSAKDSSVEKLIEKLKTIYLEKEDENIRSAVGVAFHSMAQNHQEKTKAYAETIVPLVFFAMHTTNIKTDGLNDSIVWEDVWNEVTTGGSEVTLKKYIGDVSEFLQGALASASWPVRAQAARSIKTLAEKIGDSLENDRRDALVDLLVNALQGRVWDGKEHLLFALSTLCKKTLSLKSSEKVDVIVEAFFKECKKSNLSYKKVALISTGDILETLSVDKFSDIYSLVEEILAKDSASDNSEDGDDNSKKQEEIIGLREAAFETLGKAWPTNENTQVLFREKVILQCVACLKCNTRPVQVSIMSSVVQYLEKLTLLCKQPSGDNECEELNNILFHIMEALSYSLSIPKHTRLRKEALNVFLLLVKKLQDNLWKDQLHKLNSLFSANFEELNQDNSPEVKTRVLDIKEFFKELE